MEKVQRMKKLTTNQSTMKLEKNFKGSGSIAERHFVCLWRHTKLNYSVSYKKKRNRLWGRESRMKAQESKKFIQQQMRRTERIGKWMQGGGMDDERIAGLFKMNF